MCRCYSDSSSRERSFRCWHCALPLSPTLVKRDGFIQPRSEKYGGPFYIYRCPKCGAKNRCEATVKGTMFASPPYEPSVLDFLIGKLLPSEGEERSAAVEFLKVASWYEREKERRRYVFERDGDFRYSSFFERIRWYLRRKRAPSLPPRKEREEIPSPYKILGVPPGASLEQINRAFRRLAKRYHPDKAHFLGPELEELAHQKFKQLLEAYQELTERERKGKADSW